jgi:hypothetical protein
MTVGPEETFFDPRYPLEPDELSGIIVGYRTPVRGRLEVPGQVSQPIFGNVKSILRDFATNWNTDSGKNIVEAMRLGNWISPGTKSPASIINGFKQVIATAQLRNQSYEEVLASSLSQGADMSRTAGGGGPFRSETTSVTEYDETNVTDIANNAAKQRLGRTATKKERELLATALNEAQRKSPTVTISEGTTSGGTMTGADGQRTARGTVSTTTTRGGIDAAEIAAEQAIQAEDFEERFFVSTFTDMLKDLSKPAV